MNVPNDKVL